jgi:diphosphate-dependent phosphofructokinase
VVGRSCGWLTAATARKYTEWLASREWLAGIGLDRRQWDVHALFIPELSVDIAAEAQRLSAVMDEVGNVNIFIAEGAGVAGIVAEIEASGEEVPRDAFGHVRLDKVNPGQWFGSQFATMLGAEKTQVFKSGYFARAAASNAEDIALIKQCTDLAVDCAIRGESGVIGQDEDQGDVLRAIEFPRIAGGKPFDIDEAWFDELLLTIGQAKGAKAPDISH